jgi:hypothetical protein
MPACASMTNVLRTANSDCEVIRVGQIFLSLFG